MSNSFILVRNWQGEAKRLGSPLRPEAKLAKGPNGGPFRHSVS